MAIEWIIILAAMGICVVLGTWSALATRDSWDEDVQAEKDWDEHKATLGIYQEPGEEQWEKDLAALRWDQKHRLC